MLLQFQQINSNMHSCNDDSGIKMNLNEHNAMELNEVLVETNNLTYYTHKTELHQKSEHFWTFPTLTSYSNNLNLNQMSLDLNLTIMAFSIFSEQALCCESGKIIPMPKFLSTLSFSLLFFLCFFCF